MIEVPVKLSDVKISLRLDEEKPEKVYIAPEKKSLRYKMEDGYINVKVPECTGFICIPSTK